PYTTLFRSSTFLGLKVFSVFLNRWRKREVYCALANTLLSWEVHAMAEPVFIITTFVVFTSMRTARLFTCLCSNCSCLCNFKHILQFKSFDTCCVKGTAFVDNLNIFDTLTHLLELNNTFLHELTGAEYTEVILHAVL